MLGYAFMAVYVVCFGLCGLGWLFWCLGLFFGVVCDSVMGRLCLWF